MMKPSYAPSTRCAWIFPSLHRSPGHVGGDGGEEHQGEVKGAIGSGIAIAGEQIREHLIQASQLIESNNLNNVATRWEHC
eukprot:12883632-Prorocentrum_lima.AAC.1